MNKAKIFVGYDSREKVAYHTFVESCIQHSSVPLEITPLSLNHLNGYKELHTDGSNDFIYTRFLVPFLSNYTGISIFFDGDMILRTDIQDLLNLIDLSKAVQVVQHDYKTKVSVKYLGSKNEDYPRKNWSSVIIFNNAHEANRVLTPEFVMEKPGSYLHRFSWLSDELIGSLPIEWNWLISEYSFNPNCRLAHFTLGTPCFSDFQNQDLSSEWLHYKMEAMSHLER